MARRWAGADVPPPPPVRVNASVIEAMQAYGAPPEAIEQARALIPPEAPPPSADVEVWPENMLAVGAFFAVCTQWDHAEMSGRRLRLNYPGVWCVLDRMYPRRRRRTLFAAIQTMEQAVLEADAELAAAKSTPAAPTPPNPQP